MATWSLERSENAGEVVDVAEERGSPEVGVEEPPVPSVRKSLSIEAEEKSPFRNTTAVNSLSPSSP